MRRLTTSVAQSLVLFILFALLVTQRRRELSVSSLSKQVPLHNASRLVTDRVTRLYNVGSTITTSAVSFTAQSESQPQLTTWQTLTVPETPRLDSQLAAASTQATGEARLMPTSTACLEKEGDTMLIEQAHTHIRAIMNATATEERLSCGALNATRYSDLHIQSSSTRKRRYFFALDLYQSAHIINQLLGAIVEVMRFLGPDLCTLSIVEGRSTDGTFEVLNGLNAELVVLGVNYILTCSAMNPSGEGADRIATLADLRNQALEPLFQHADQYDPSTTIIFVNDVAPCAEDLLELVHQRATLQADMTCAMDWIHDGDTFYDVWIGRQLNGDSFFEIPQSISWEFSDNLFWNHDESRRRFDSALPVQVFSCWNGAVAITAKPFLEGHIRFRSKNPGECYLGEPVHLAKDLWKLGLGKIAVVPTVNLAYTIEASVKTKEKRGTVSSWVKRERSRAAALTWRERPPGQIKCMVTWDHPSWEFWDQGM